MSSIMAVLLNGIAQLEYDRARPLPVHQAASLDKMDEKMDAGIFIGGQTIHNPDLSQRTQFVAANLVHALNSNDETMAGALCSYLAARLPDLQQVRIEDESGEISIEMVFDEPYRKQVAVEFSLLH